MRRLAVVLAIAAAVGGGCIVVEREADRPGSTGERPDRPHTDIPQADPAPLRPSSDRRLLGSLGWALLSPDVPRAVLEIDRLGGAALSDGAVAALERALRDHGGKETTDLVVADVPSSRDEYSLEGMLDVTDQHRDHASGDGTVAVHVLVLPGRFEAEGVPGVAFHATAFAVFPEAIASRLPAGADVDAFEAAVAVHELGHLFGLVNRTGVGEFHEDPEHPGHNDDPSSVMYWAVESPSLTEVFRTGPPSEFGDADRQEMERIREQRP